MTTRSLTSNTARTALDQHSNGRREVLRRLSLFAIAAALGGAGWSGNIALNLLALLYPYIYLQSRHRSDSFSAVFYYAAATWSVIPGACRFFGQGRSPSTARPHLDNTNGAVRVALACLLQPNVPAVVSDRLITSSGDPTSRSGQRCTPSNCIRRVVSGHTVVRSRSSTLARRTLPATWTACRRS